MVETTESATILSGYGTTATVGRGLRAFALGQKQRGAAANEKAKRSAGFPRAFYCGDPATAFQLQPDKIAGFRQMGAIMYALANVDLSGLLDVVVSELLPEEIDRQDRCGCEGLQNACHGVTPFLARKP